MVTLKDIAVRCGLSAATVSKALNGMPDVGAETAARIRDLASRLGYRPNSAARSMKTGRSMMIGMLLFLQGESVWSHCYFSRVADSVHRELEKNGYALTPVNNNAPSTMGSYLNYCRHRNYDGVIVMSNDYTEPTLMELIDSDFPLVTFDYAFAHRSAVLSDNICGMRDLVRYVYRMGYTKIAFIHGEKTPVTIDRIESFRHTCARLKLRIPEEYILQARYHDPKSSYEATERLLKLPDPPTCICYPDDFSYSGGRNAILNRGLRIPEDVSATGYDGTSIIELYRPTLTSFQQDCAGLGFQAARLLLESIQHPAHEPEHVLLKGKLLERATVFNRRRI